MLGAYLVGPVISAGAGFLGVLVASALIPWIRSSVSRRRLARYLAIRMVCIFETFVDDCSKVAFDWGDPDKPGIAKAAVLPVVQFPSDLDWGSIDPHLMYDILSLPAHVERAIKITETYRANAEPLDFYEYFEERNLLYSQLGIRAHDLALRIREHFGIPEFEQDGWSSVGHLREVVYDIQKGRRAREKGFESDQRGTHLA